MKNKNLILKYGYGKDNFLLKSKIFSDFNEKITLYVPIYNLKYCKKILNVYSNKINFFIDPCSYLWLDNSFEAKSNNKKEIINKIFGEENENKNIDEKIKDLENSKYLLKIIKETINEQNIENTLDEIEQQYLDFIDIQNNTIKYIVPPSFAIIQNKIDKDVKKIININKKILNIIYNEQKYNNNFLHIICLNPKLILDEEFFNLFLENNTVLKNKNILFWLDNFSLSKYKEHEIKKFLSFFNFFEGKNKFLLHSDFATSFLLNKHLLKNNFNSMITNIGYGEKRKIFDEGGRAKIYYYSPILHKRLRSNEFEIHLNDMKAINNKDGNINKEQFLKNICGCQYCSNILEIENNIYKIVHLIESKKEYLNNKDKQKKELITRLFLEHFLYSKFNEYKKISTLDKKELIKYISKIKKLSSTLLDENEKKFFKNLLLLLKDKENLEENNE